MRSEEDDTPQESAPDSAVPGKRHKRDSTRPSMRREFMDLFRDTRASNPGAGGVETRPTVAPVAARVPDDALTPAAPPAETERAASSSAEPSPFLRKFLQQASPDAEPARSGLPGLDSRLGGGFSPGLHLVLGPASAINTAFLEALAWEAVGSRRPALYFTLRAGSLRVWERLIGTMATFVDGSGLAPAALRGRDLEPADLETLARLDAALQATVLPYLSLIDRPAGGCDLSAFVTALRSHALEAAEKHARLPLVLIDGLDELLAATGSLPPALVIARLDEALAADSLPGLLTAGSAACIQQDDEQLPGRSILGLEAPATGPAMVGARVDLRLLKNSATGWTGELSLLLDPSSGLFAEA